MKEQEYLEGLKKQFLFYKKLSEGAISQISDGQFFYSQAKGTNSVAVLVRHLSGNIFSRWTNMLTTDGEKEWRRRDREFIIESRSREDIMEIWKKAWTLLSQSFDDIKIEDLNKRVVIRNRVHTLPDALHRQLAHIAYHSGQIVFQCKWLLGDRWKNLSIPRGQSEQFNKKAFQGPLRKEHFTDDYFKEP